MADSDDPPDELLRQIVRAFDARRAAHTSPERLLELISAAVNETPRLGPAILKISEGFLRRGQISPLLHRDIEIFVTPYVATAERDPEAWAETQAERLSEMRHGPIINGRWVVVGSDNVGANFSFSAMDVSCDSPEHQARFKTLSFFDEYPGQGAFEFRPSFEDFSARLLGLSHPNICSVVDVAYYRDRLCIIAERPQGPSLSEAWRKRPSDRGEPSRLPSWLEIVRTLGAALSHAHSHGWIHGDVRPGTIYMNDNTTPRLFGFWKQSARAAYVRSPCWVNPFDSTAMGGCPDQYASCERCEGTALDVRDDLYSLACLAFRMISGSHPFDNRSGWEARDLSLVPRRIATLSRSQWSVLRAALSFTRRDRPATVEEFVRGLCDPRPSNLFSWLTRPIDPTASRN